MTSCKNPARHTTFTNRFQKSTAAKTGCMTQCTTAYARHGTHGRHFAGCKPSPTLYKTSEKSPFQEKSMRFSPYNPIFVMQHFLLESSSSHLAGRECGENKNAIFSPFFALKSLKKRFDFYLIFVSKPMQKCNILSQLLRFCRNILQTNKLSWFFSRCLISIEHSKLPHNSLTYKILTQNKRKIKEKCKKTH